MKKGKDFRMPAIACALIIVMCIGFVVSYGLAEPESCPC